jgi:hypothetical protein
MVAVLGPNEALPYHIHTYIERVRKETDAYTERHSKEEVRGAEQ